MTFYFNLESLVLPDSQVHHFYTSSSRPIFGDVRRCSAILSELQFTIVTVVHQLEAVLWIHLLQLTGSPLWY